MDIHAAERAGAGAVSDTILDLLPIGVVVMDARDLRILAANQTVRSLPGAPWREVAVIGRRLRELPDDPNIRRFAAACRYVLRTGEPLQIKAFPLGGARPAYWDFSFAPVRDADGAIVRLLATIADVTPEVTLQKAMEESNQELRRQNAELATLNRLAIGVNSARDFHHPLPDRHRGAPQSLRLRPGRRRHPLGGPHLRDARRLFLRRRSVSPGIDCASPWRATRSSSIMMRHLAAPRDQRHRT